MSRYRRIPSSVRTVGRFMRWDRRRGEQPGMSPEAAAEAIAIVKADPMAAARVRAADAHYQATQQRVSAQIDLQLNVGEPS